MDDRIIDFNELKNKAKEKDVDKLEDYMYSLYYQMAEGKITMADFTKSIYKYMDDNNISQDKFFNIQKKLMERYGFDPSNLDEQLKAAGVNIGEIGKDYEELRRTISFQEKYNGKISSKNVSVYYIKNEINDIKIVLQDENVSIQSTKTIDLNDNELGEFLCSYKKVLDNKNLKIEVCENVKSYNY
ncbi:MAG: DUF3867 domain-containing protein [Clostridiales bacterium]|nr:DUF3867 domain-containing protein [Clostridiales bacterium]